ncbi:MAG: AMIN domain-containing protein [Cyanobacteria bacterium P01_H01_bin.121]
MKRHLGLGSLIASGAIVALAAQPVQAAATIVKSIRLNPTSAGLELALETRSGDRPQLFTVGQGNTLIADIINTQLQLPNGGNFQQTAPAPGIDSISVIPLDANSIRVTVQGTNTAPVGQVSQRGDNQLVLNFNSAPSNTANRQSNVPQSIAQAQPEAAPEAAPVVQEPAQVPGTPEVLVPDPEITIDGVPAVVPGVEAAPPFLPRAVAPPLGDIAISELDASPDTIDLGTAERVQRLLLQDAPAREVLSLLARAANLNVVFTTRGDEDDTTSTGNDGADSGGPPISLDIENEPVQDVFNYVLRVANLEANRTGRTIFVGPRLPDSARNVTVRTLRMNQVSAEDAANFLTAQGAESQIPIERVQLTSIGEGAAARIVETRTPEILALRAEGGAGPLVLRGLSVSTSNRLNAITLVGTPQKIRLATNLLKQLDLRQRQVAVNVKILDINLSNLSEIGTSFSFGVGDTSVINSGGTGVVNFGSRQPATTGAVSPTIGLNPVGATQGLFNIFDNLFVQIQALVTSNNAKILTDPTLVVQEGQTATVNLTQEVITNIEFETNENSIAVTTEQEEVGLILGVNVQRIDDNGFVTFSVDPTVSSPAGAETITIPGFGGSDASSQTITLISRRALSSGPVRIRDGQTLILAGIIQDSEITSVSKIPFLGDLPIIGSLFRRTSDDQTRAEVIVLVTPQIIDDADSSIYGYSYFPSDQAREVLER